MSPKQLLVIYVILMKMHFRAGILCIIASLFPGLEREPLKLVRPLPSVGQLFLKLG